MDWKREHNFLMAVISIKNKTKSGSLLAGNAYYVPPSFESIATATPNGVSTITFSSIPDTYKHLQLRFNVWSNDNSIVGMRFNSDTGSNYSFHFLRGGGSSSLAEGYANSTRIDLHAGQTIYSNNSTMSVGVVDIPDYASSTKNKTSRTLWGKNNNGSGVILLGSGLWRNTAAITSITLYLDTGTYTSPASISLYGIKG
jgi:hypothetical protein